MRFILITLLICKLILQADENYLLALSYYYDSNKSNDAQALKLLKKEVKNADASFLIALAYDQGSIVEKDPSKALFWYEKAANLGDIDAIMITGWRYYKGEGYKKDYEKAAFWFEKAATLGDKEAIGLLNIISEENLF